MATSLNIVCVSGTREKLQMASMFAATAAVSGSVVTVFLSMNAIKYFVRDNNQHAPVEGEIGFLMEQKQVPPFEDLFRQAVELGEAKLYPCSMAMEVLGIQDSELHSYIEESVGLTTYLSKIEDGQVMTF